MNGLLSRIVGLGVLCWTLGPGSALAGGVQTYNEGYRLHQAGDYSGALSRYLDAAEQGVAAAMVNIGMMYTRGEGVARDNAESARWFGKAADAGDSVGMFNLGNMYADGLGVARDEAEAVRWYRKSADAGNAYAMTSLGRMYAQGRGVARDEAEAVRWLRQSMEADPANGYTVLELWAVLTDQRQAAAARAATDAYRREQPPKDWLAELFAFAAGEIDEAELLRRAGRGNADDLPGQRCEAYYYAGRVRLARGDRAGALELFRKSVATGKRDFFEYEGAQAMIDALARRR